MLTIIRKKQVISASILTLALVALVTGTAGCRGGGSAKNIKIDGVDGPYVNFVDNKLTMAVVLENVQLDFGARIVVPMMPNSYLEVGPDFQTNGYLIDIGIDARDIKALAGDAVNLLDPSTLPGGRPLPGIASGMLPGVSIQIPKWHNLAIYLGANVLGVFVPVNLPWKDYMATARFYDATNTAIGNIAVVGQDGEGNNAGFLLMINLRGKVGQLIGLK